MTDIAKMFIGQLADHFIPKDKLDPGVVEETIEKQALLLAAHEAGIHDGKNDFDRIKALDTARDDLAKAGVGADKIAAARARIGQIELPREVPAFGQLLALPTDVKQTLLAVQAVARMEAILKGESGFAEPRLFGDEAPYLQAAQNGVLQFMQGGASADALADVKSQITDPVNAVWQRHYGVDLINTNQGGETPPAVKLKPTR